MTFDESVQQYVFENDGLIFAWDEEPEDDYQEKVQILTKNYYKNLDHIVSFMLPDIEEMFGETSTEEVKINIGKPIIEYNIGTVSYCEQTFDDCHIFTFEFSDDEFEDLAYFSVDG